MKSQIRNMQPEDWPRVGEIYSQALEIGISTFQRNCPSYEDWDRSHLKIGRLVYEADGLVAGWIALSPTSARECYRGVVEVSVYIDKAFQHQGVGKALMAKVEEESRAAGFWSLYSSVFAVNEASLALHEVCGFRKIGYRERIAKDRFDQWQDTILFEKRL
ncbi:MAG: GNAT family N-acetyltransferase [Negativibacillus sp.]